MRLIAALTLMAFLPFSAFAQTEARTDAEIKELALQAILENPEIILEAVAILEKRDQERQAQGALQIAADLEASSLSPVMGNPDGDVTIIEFADYNCGFCRRASPVLQEVMAEDGNIKVILREWPILGEESVFASRAALAAMNQGKYMDFHFGMMNSGGRAGEATTRLMAAELGLDVDQLMADMEDPSVAAHLDETNAAARALGISGTPAFIIGGQVNPGFMEKEQMLAMIAAAREANN